jgi:hypothetical protein
MKKIQTFEKFSIQNEEIDWKKMRNTAMAGAMAGAMAIGPMDAHGQNKKPSDVDRIYVRIDHDKKYEKTLNDVIRFAVSNGFGHTTDEGGYSYMVNYYEKGRRTEHIEISIHEEREYIGDKVDVKFNVRLNFYMTNKSIAKKFLDKYCKGYNVEFVRDTYTAEKILDPEKVKSEIIKFKSLGEELIRMGFKS